MKRLTSCLAVGICVVLLGFVFTANASGQGTVEKASFTLTEPLDVGGTILQPGDYQITVVRLQGDRNMLRVTNPNGT